MQYIINADDFGLHKSCSLAIAEAFSLNLITDTTMCANGDYFDYAIQLAKGGGFVDRIGIHFNITTGKPLTEEIKCCREFCDEDGLFYRDKNRYNILSSSQKRILFQELTAQYEKITAQGIQITHADSHHHIHTAPAYFSVFSDVFKNCGIKKVRILRNVGIKNPVRLGVIQTINHFYLKNHHITTDFFAHASAYFNPKHLRAKGVAEIMVHPDYAPKTMRLIDRSQYVHGIPHGKDLCSFVSILNLTPDILTSYSVL